MTDKFLKLDNSSVYYFFYYLSKASFDGFVQEKCPGNFRTAF